MSRQESKAAYERMLEIVTLGGSIDSSHGWGKNYYMGKRNARTYVDKDSDTYEARVVELNHGELHITLSMYGQLPDDANLEFANTIMDAAEKVIKEGTTER